jgi:hypothetical protein
MTGDDTLYVWQEQEPSGEWGTIAAGFAGATSIAGPIPLVTRNRDLATGHFQTIARGHMEASGRPIRLSAFEHKETVLYEAPQA